MRTKGWVIGSKLEPQSGARWRSEALTRRSKCASEAAALLEALVSSWHALRSQTSIGLGLDPLLAETLAWNRASIAQTVRNNQAD